MIAYIVISLAILLAIGIPICFVLGLTALFYYIIKGDPTLFPMIPQQLFGGMDMYLLLAIPFFILAGEVMRSSGITRNLVRFSNALVGHFRGGLAYVNIVASIFFSGITGSAVADTSAIGTVMIPSMVEDGYDLDFSAAVTAASSVIGPIIPPSILMIIYSAIMDVSVAGMFAAGFIPGLLVGLSLCVLSYYYARKRNYPTRERRATVREFLSAGHFGRDIHPDGSGRSCRPLRLRGGISLQRPEITHDSANHAEYGHYILDYPLRHRLRKDDRMAFRKRADSPESCSGIYVHYARPLFLSLYHQHLALHCRDDHGPRRCDHHSRPRLSPGCHQYGRPSPALRHYHVR